MSFQWSLSSITDIFHSAVPPFPHQPPAGTGGISHRLSPVWTWSQRQPSAAVYVWLFHHLMGLKNESCCPKHGMRSVWPVPQASCVPLSCRFLSQSGCGYWFFLLTAGPPDLRYPLCSCSHIHLCPCDALTL